MAKYRVLVHTLTGSGIAGEKELGVGDKINETHIDETTATKFVSMGWIEKVEGKADDVDAWKSKVETIEAKAKELEIEIPSEFTKKADKLQFIENHLASLKGE